MKNRIINEKIEEALDEQFPKGKCKERGHALVLFAVAQKELDDLQGAYDIAMLEINRLRKKLGYK
jgi:hypothetical protein